MTSNQHATGKNNSEMVLRTGLPSIQSIDFINGSSIVIHLSNDRTIIVPLDKFPAIQKLSDEQKKDFEILDDCHLSFLASDEVYSVKDLLDV